MSLTLNGKTKYVPGVYGQVNVITSGATAIPNFNGLLIVGSAKQGIPYNAGKGYEVIRSFTSVSDAKAFYGDSDLVNAMAEAKKGGAGMVYLLNPAPLTQAKVTIKDTNTTPKNLFDLKPVFYGAAGNDIRVDISQSGNNLTISITPPKDTHYIAEDLDATGKVNVLLDSVSGLSVGDIIKSVDNNSTSVTTHTITDIDTQNNRITVDTAITSKTRAAYGRIFKHDTDNKKSKTWDKTISGLLNSILLWLNQTGYVVAEKQESYDGDITLIETISEYLGLISGATKGTSPTATETAEGDFVNCALTLDRLLEEFTSYTGGRVRIVNVVSGKPEVHGAFLSLANSVRTNEYPIVVVSGCELGDINLPKTNSSHPIQRAKGLNSDDFVLAGMGYNKLPAYKSLACQFAGLLSASRVEKNLTKDPITANEVEYFFGGYNRDTDTAAFVQAGVLVVETTKQGFVIAQAVNTYQKQESIWNASDDKTYLVQQRQIVDYVYEGFRSGMQVIAGSENLTEVTATALALGILDRFLSEGVIVDRKIVSVERVGNAIIVRPAITPIDATDFVGFELQVTIH